MNMNQYELGDIVAVLDNIGLEDFTFGTIQKIEPNDYMISDNTPDGVEGDFNWLYLRANDDLLNTNMDPNIGLYWRVIESVSPYLRLVSKATHC